MSTDSAAAEVHTITEFSKYLASGTVRHMSMYGLIVIGEGIQLNELVTSLSGFSELLTIA
jgi:hypothetical protein